METFIHKLITHPQSFLFILGTITGLILGLIVLLLEKRAEKKKTND